MNRSNAHDPRAIANRIWELRQAQSKPLTAMQLIKLVYIADGWAMALLGRPLSKEQPEAWQYGPVYPSVYRAFKRFGGNPVGAPAVHYGSDIPISETFSDDECEVINSVVDAYGKFSAYQLSNLTHQPGAPWSQAFNAGVYSSISDSAMLNHFNELRDRQIERQD